MSKKKSAIWFLIGAVTGSAGTVGVINRSKLLSFFKKKKENTED